MNKRLDRNTSTTIQQEHYSDFMNNLDLNPITGLLAKVTNEDAVKQSLKNLIYTNRTERFYNPFIGSRLRSLMFEPMDSVTQQLLSKEINETISNNEPRVEILNVIVTPREDQNRYDIKIVFRLINRPEQTLDLNLSLKRVR